MDKSTSLGCGPGGCKGGAADMEVVWAPCVGPITTKSDKDGDETIGLPLDGESLDRGETWTCPKLYANVRGDRVEFS